MVAFIAEGESTVRRVVRPLLLFRLISEIRVTGDGNDFLDDLVWDDDAPYSLRVIDLLMPVPWESL